MDEQSILMRVTGRLGEQSPKKQRALCWLLEHINDIERLISGKYIAPREMKNMIDTFIDQEAYELAWLYERPINLKWTNAL